MTIRPPFSHLLQDEVSFLLAEGGLLCEDWLLPSELMVSFGLSTDSSLLPVDEESLKTSGLGAGPEEGGGRGGRGGGERGRGGGGGEGRGGERGMEEGEGRGRRGEGGEGRGEGGGGGEEEGEGRGWRGESRGADN